MAEPPRGLRCAWCGLPRPDDDQPCPACDKPRFRHKTADAEEFWERQQLIQQHDPHHPLRERKRPPQ